MNVFYDENILYVDMLKDVNNDNVSILENKIFKILDDYNIKDVNIKMHKRNYDEYIFDSLIINYNKKYKGNLNIE